MPLNNPVILNGRVEEEVEDSVSNFLVLVLLLLESTLVGDFDRVSSLLSKKGAFCMCVRVRVCIVCE